MSLEFSKNDYGHVSQGLLITRGFARFFGGISLARPEGFEPPTPGSEVQCSIQLSYERVEQIVF